MLKKNIKIFVEHKEGGRFIDVGIIDSAHEVRPIGVWRFQKSTSPVLCT